MMEKLTFYIKHSLNDLRVNGQRTLFALLCIAAGVAAIVSLQTLGVMIENTLTGSLQETNKGDILISPRGDFELGDSGDEIFELREADGIVESEDDFESYFTTDAITTLDTWFAEVYDGDVEFTYTQSGGGSTAGIGVSIPERETDKGFVFPYIIEADKYPLYGIVQTDDGVPLSELIQAPTDIVFSQNLADDLGAEVGDTVRISQIPEDFTLRAIVPTDSEGGLNDAGLFAAILGYYYIDVSAMDFVDDITKGEAAQIFVALGSNADVDAISRALETRYPYLDTRTTTDLEELNSEISNTVDDFVTIMGLVSMLIGGIGIVNTMLVIVSRRTTEIAVLKTIGFEPQEVTILFIVEAILMGILGGIGGIVLGWLATLGLEQFAEQTVGQNLVFTIALAPVINGFVVGILVTTIFGFIPTLAAGQVRPASVLRPNETVIPQAGRLQSFAALMVVLLLLALVTQGILGDLITGNETVQLTAAAAGALIGLLMIIPLIVGDALDMRSNPRGRSWALRIFIWIVLLPIIPVGIALYGYFVPAVAVVAITFLIVGSLYLLLLQLIWAFGGGSITEFPILGNFPNWVSIPVFIGLVAWAILVVLVVGVLPLPTIAIGLFLGLLFWIHIPAIIVTLTLPAWFLGQLFQRFGFLDLKISLRAMVATKGRGASTLLALVIGIFVLSLITMLVDTILNQFEQELEQNTGGNVIIFPSGGTETAEQVAVILDEQEGVQDYATSRIYEADFVKLTDVSEEETLDLAAIRERIIISLEDSPIPLEDEDKEDIADTFEFTINNVDARELDSNLPEVEFYDGQQLDPLTDTEPNAAGYYPIVITATQAVIDAGIEAGDLIAYSFSDGSIQTFYIAGMIDAANGSVDGFGSNNYAALEAFGDRASDQQVIIANVDEEAIPTVRRELSNIPGVFVLETSVLNDLITTVIGQFTSFPTLVAVLSLFVGGVVIANSVALSTMERRREIGIMKAIGLQRERVLGMLLLENGIMGFVGGLIGVGISVLLLLLLLSGVFGLSESVDALPLNTGFLLMAGCIGIALLASILTVWGASGEKPMNVLRYE